MEIFSLGLGGWLRRLSRRNPLVRTSDRIEATAALIVFIVALLAIPVVGTVGTAIYDGLAHRFAADRFSRQEVVATVSDDSSLKPMPYEKPFVTTIKWQFAGHPFTDEVRTSDRVKAGERQTIWIDTEGNRTMKPLANQDAATEAVASAFGLWFTTVGVAAAALTVLRIRLNRRRSVDWDRELQDLADNGGRTDHNA